MEEEAAADKQKQSQNVQMHTQRMRPLTQSRFSVNNSSSSDWQLLNKHARHVTKTKKYIEHRHQTFNISNYTQFMTGHKPSVLATCLGPATAHKQPGNEKVDLSSD